MKALAFGGAVIAFLVPLAFSAFANDRIISLQASTPDISVGTQATVAAIAPAGRATWVYLKNNCAQNMHFDLRGKAGDSANDFPLTLESSQSFQANISLRTVSASADGNQAAACTFTVLFGN